MMLHIITKVSCATIFLSSFIQEGELFIMEQDVETEKFQRRHLHGDSSWALT